MASKLVKERAKKTAARVGKAGVENLLAETLKSVAPAQPAATAPKSSADYPYCVMVDQQGVGYLRVAYSAKGAIYVMNTGSAVDVVDIDTATAKSRNLHAVPEESVLDAVNIFSRPLNSGVTITERSKKYLNQILNDKEFHIMATKKATSSKSTKKASTAAPKKAAKTAKSANGAAGKVGRVVDKKITVLSKDHGAREGSKRAKAMELLFKSKNTSEAIPQLKKMGADNSFITFAVKSGFIKLHD